MIRDIIVKCLRWWKLATFGVVTLGLVVLALLGADAHYVNKIERERIQHAKQKSKAKSTENHQLQGDVYIIDMSDSSATYRLNKDGDFYRIN